MFGKGTKTQGTAPGHTLSKFKEDRLYEITEELESMKQQLVLYERGKEKSVGGGLFGQAATLEEQCRKLRKKMRDRWNKAEEIQKSLASTQRRKKRKLRLKQQRLARAMENEAELNLESEEEIEILDEEKPSDAEE